MHIEEFHTPTYPFRYFFKSASAEFFRFVKKSNSKYKKDRRLMNSSGIGIATGSEHIADMHSLIRTFRANMQALGARK